jgi:hypothetical protein
LDLAFCLLKDRTHSLFSSEQFCGDSLVEGIFQELVYLQLQIAVAILFKHLLCIEVDNGSCFECAAAAEFDILGIAEKESAASDVLVEGVSEQSGERVDFKVSGHKAGLVEVVYVLGEYSLARLCELDDFNKELGDIIGCQHS